MIHFVVVRMRFTGPLLNYFFFPLQHMGLCEDLASLYPLFGDHRNGHPDSSLAVMERPQPLSKTLYGKL